MAFGVALGKSPMSLSTNNAWIIVSTDNNNIVIFCVGSRFYQWMIICYLCCVGSSFLEQITLDRILLHLSWMFMCLTNCCRKRWKRTMEPARVSTQLVLGRTAWPIAARWKMLSLWGISLVNLFEQLICYIDPLILSVLGFTTDWIHEAINISFSFTCNSVVGSCMWMLRMNVVSAWRLLHHCWKSTTLILSKLAAWRLVVRQW